MRNFTHAFPGSRHFLLVLLAVLCLLSGFSASAESSAPKITLSVSNMPLEKVCKEVERQTGYYFVYPKDLNKSGYQLTLDIHDVAMQEALRKIFEGLPFSYQVIDRVIVVNTVKRATEQRLAENVEGRMIKVRGGVFSETGQPLVGASVTIKANGKTTLTDLKGEFNFNEAPENSVLIMSYIGYTTQQTRAVENEFIRVRLAIATNELDATVIKGYYNTTRRLNTGNVVVVKGEDIIKQPVTDPLLALEGRVPGFYIQQTSGVPGAYSTMFLRGMNSIPGGGTKLSTVNDPLFIVDGIPFSTSTLSSTFISGGIVGQPTTTAGPIGMGLGLSPFNNINPADIESIEVLKDADATAIYGARGANGVVLITTKKGKVGVTKIDLNVYTGIGKTTRTLQLMNTQQYLQMRREAFRNDGQKPGEFDFDVNGFWDTTRYTDWQKVMLGNAARFTNMQAEISGGNANTQYSLGGGYSSQGTTLPGNYADRKATGHIGLTATTTDQRFTAQFSSIYTVDNSNLPGTAVTDAILLAPNAPPIYTANHDLNWQPYEGGATFPNPFAYTFGYSKATSNFLNSSMGVIYKITRNLELKSNFGYSQREMDQIGVSPANSKPPPLNTNPDSRGAVFANTKTKTWIIEPQIVFHSQIVKGRLEILAGSTFQENSSLSQAQQTYTYSSDVLIPNPKAAGTYLLAGYSQALYKYNAFFGRVNYNWEEKYLLNLTVRRDGSSRFGPSKQFGNFGAVGAAWVFSKEDFMQDKLPFLSFGKIRASYGITGNDNVTDFAFLSTYSPVTYSYQGVTGLSPTLLPNPYYAWERVKKIEAAIELGFLKDRVSFTFSAYRNRTDNQLVGYPVPYITGFPNVQANLPALIENTGLEFTLATTNISTKDFIWTSSVNLSVPRNKLIAYPNLASSGFRNSYVIGKSLFIRPLYHATGVDPQRGVYTFATKDGSGTPSFPRDNSFSKPVTQLFYGGFRNNFRYKGFQLDVFIQFVKQWKDNYIGFFNLPGSDNQNLPVFMLDRWQKQGDRISQQKYSTGNFGGPAVTMFSFLKSSDATITEASFARLKSLSLSYQLPSKWQQKAHLQNVQIFLQCQNLFTMTKFQGFDPETSNAVPPMRMITGGFHVTL